MARADGDSRHKMALQVSLDTAGEAEVERKVEEVLTLPAFAAWPITAIKVHSSFEWLVQFDLDRETQTKKEAILQDLIKNLPQLQGWSVSPTASSFTKGTAPWLELIM